MKHPSRLHWQDLTNGPELLAEFGLQGWRLFEKDGCAWYSTASTRKNLSAIRRILAGRHRGIRILPV